MLGLHSDHQRARIWLEKAKNGDIEALVSAHSLAEVYSVLTRMPRPLQVSTNVALQLIEHNILNCAEVIALTADDYRDLIRHLSQIGIAGGAVYDGIIACAAAKAQAGQIVTLNAKDFRRIYPALAASIVVP
jgi:predicted nucleic acid-binding protein